MTMVSEGTIFAMTNSQLQVRGQFDGSSTGQMHSIPQKKAIVSATVLQVERGVIIYEFNSEVMLTNHQQGLVGSWHTPESNFAGNAQDIYTHLPGTNG